MKAPGNLILFNVFCAFFRVYFLDEALQGVKQTWDGLIFWITDIFDPFIKFVFSKNDTAIDEMFTVDLTLTT